MFSFLWGLLTSPVELSWQLAVGATALLVLLCYIVAFTIALVHAHAASSWKELLVTPTRLKVSWMWGWIASAAALWIYALVLNYLDRFSSWMVGLPYLGAEILILLIATLYRRTIRESVVRVQKILQGGRA